ncbi:MAG: hypothetical protein AAFO96_21275 [Bacteroidota bacterium]
MFHKIFRFELRSRFSQWMTLLFALMLIFQGIWYTKGYYDYYGGDGMYLNAAGVMYQNLAGCGLLMVIIVAVITGPTLYKDIQFKSAQWVYALPVNEKQFFLSRFLSAFLINVIIASAYMIGMVIVPYSGIGEANLFGPTPYVQMLYGFFLLTVPNLFLLTSLAFCALAIFRQAAAGYLAIFLTVIAFLLLQSAAEAVGYSPLFTIGEPFGFVAVNQQVDMMTIAERNSGFFHLSGDLLANRLLWVGISSLMIIIAYNRFSFKYFLQAGNQKKKRQRSLKVKPSATLREKTILTVPTLSFGTGDFLRKLWSLSRLEFKNVVRPFSFRIIAGILVLMVILQNLLWNASYYIGPQVPLTSGMTQFRLNTGVFIVILLMIWAGELFFKDRTANMWQIADALPVPVWVSQLSRLFAMFGVALVLSLILMLCGIFSQILRGGGAEIDMGLFLNDLLGYNWGWANYCLYIMLAFFLAGLTGKRYLTHVLGAGYFFFLIVVFEFGIWEELRSGYGFTPGFEDYSEINGYGMWTEASFYYFLMWLMLGIMMVLLGILFWDRGLAKSMLTKLRFYSRQLNLTGKLAIPVFLSLFVLLQSFIFQEVNQEDNFEASAISEAIAARYETKYGFLETKNQPYYQSLDMELDLYPNDRKATYSIQANLANINTQAIDSLYLNLPEKTTLHVLHIQGTSLKPLKVDQEHDVYTFLLPRSLDSGQVARVDMQMEKDFEGFTQGDPQASLVYKGSFASVDDYLPRIGYDRNQLLTSNRTRAANGLPKIQSILPPIAQQHLPPENIYRSDAQMIQGTLTISTSSDQLPIGPGRIEESWKEQGRQYTRFEVDKRGPLNWYMGSAPYAMAEGQNASIYYHPGHDYNLDIYEETLMQSMGFVADHLGTYPLSQVRLYEVPRYHEEIHHFASGIAISEREGWVADTSGLKERAYLRHTVATGVVSHWIQSHLNIVRVQGAEMLRVALPEALAMAYIEQALGAEAVDILLAQKIKIYNKEHLSDPNGEPALLYADGKDYLEANKGTIVLYQWGQEIGWESFCLAIKALVQEEGSHTFSQLYENLLRRTSSEERRIYWQEQVEGLEDEWKK